jgi:sugar phosphate isomerase/epimerase
MRLGFYTNYSEGIAEFAHEIGCTSLELSAWPTSSLNADTVTDDRIAEIRKDLDGKNIQISALGYYPNYLLPDKAYADEAKRYFGKLLELADRMDVRTVCTFVGQIPGVTVNECFEPFAELFTKFTDRATELGIRIGIENCPMVDYQTRLGGNIAYSPEIWEEMFRLVPSPALGIELDPSHFVFLGIDYVQAVRDFGHRIFHVHGKDVDINEAKRARQGMFGQAVGKIEGFGNGWWRFRAPGFGLVKWPDLISALIDSGYDGNIDIEHEDEVFAKAALASVEEEADIVSMFGRERNGLILGFKYLQLFAPPFESSDLLPHSPNFEDADLPIG